MTARQALDHRRQPRRCAPALADRLLVAMERRRETSHSASHVPVSTAADLAKANKDLIDIS